MWILVSACLVAMILGFVLGQKGGVPWFLAGTLLTFVLHIVLNVSTGYEGLPWADAKVLFNDSIAAYLGYNFQLTHRAFALPAVVFGAAFVLRRRLGEGSKA